MLEATLEQAAVLKKLLDAIKELVTDANFECDVTGLKLQAMDNSHVALVAVELESGGFSSYKCDRAMPLGVNLASLTKVLKCAKDDDIVRIRASDNADILHLQYEAKSTDRIADYEMKLMDIDTDTLGIPDTEYDAKVLMPSSEFQRICRDLSQLGESVRIEVSKEGVRFASDGEAANGSVLLKATEGGGGGKKGEGSNPKKEKVKKEADAEDEEMKEDEGEVEEDDGGSFKAPSPERDVDELDSEKEQEGEDEEGEGSKKRKRKANGKPKASKKTKKEVESVGGVSIQMNQTVNLTFSLKYLVNFAKSGALAGNVQLMMSNEVPLLVEYKFEQGHIRYYLAPKIGDE